MEDGKLIKRRTVLLLALFMAVLVAFFYVLYNVQIVSGSSYRQRAFYSVPKTETVETSRGEILDAYGRVLVSNATQYQITLDTALMGKERMKCIAALLELCRQEGVAWTDTLPISRDAPYYYTSLDAGRSAVIWLRSLCEALKLDQGTVTEIPVVTLPAEGDGEEDGEAPAAEPAEEQTQRVWAPSCTASELAASLTEALALESEGLSSREARDLLGVLYELTLRERQITYTEYVFARDVDIRFITLVKERKLTGVSVEAVSARKYHTVYASHILGRVGPIFREEWEGDENTVGYRELGTNPGPCAR